MWSNPINNFIEAYTIMSKYPHITHTLFLGEYVLSSEIPKIYLLTWIVVTTPFVYILFFFIGLLFFLYNFTIKKKKDLIKIFSKIFFVLLFYFQYLL